MTVRCTSIPGSAVYYNIVYPKSCEVVASSLSFSCAHLVICRDMQPLHATCHRLVPETQYVTGRCYSCYALCQATAQNVSTPGEQSPDSEHTYDRGARMLSPHWKATRASYSNRAATPAKQARSVNVKTELATCMTTHRALTIYQSSRDCICDSSSGQRLQLPAFSNSTDCSSTTV